MRYQNTITSIIRDKSHSKPLVHSIVAEIANAMISPGHSGRRGILAAAGLVSSAWLGSRTVMSMAISAPARRKRPIGTTWNRALLKMEIVQLRPNR
jgi:hypothetical protein